MDQIVYKLILNRECPNCKDSYTHPVEEVQYPTVAVCPPRLEAAPGEEYDAWQILRAAANLFLFECDDVEACAETDDLRRDFSGFLARCLSRVGFYSQGNEMPWNEILVWKNRVPISGKL